VHRHGEMCAYWVVISGNSFSKDCLEFIQEEKEAASVAITDSHYMTKFKFCILWDFMNSTKTISWLSLCD